MQVTFEGWLAVAAVSGDRTWRAAGAAANPHSTGCLLYELLGDRPPFTGTAYQTDRGLKERTPSALPHAKITFPNLHRCNSGFNH